MQVNELTGYKLYHLVLDEGSELHSSLSRFFEDEGLKHAFVLSCIGSCTEVVAAYPKTREIPPELGRSEFSGLFEINGLAGDVKRVDGQIRVHLHGSMTHEGDKVFGGAIKEGTRLFRTAELVIAGI